MEAARLGEPLRVFERFLEVAAMDDELGALRLTTTTASSPFMRAATATLWPKLPRVAAIAPRTAGRSRRSRSM